MRSLEIGKPTLSCCGMVMKYAIAYGFYVDDMNYSEELVKKAMKHTAISARYQNFYEIGDVAIYDVFVYVYLHYIENVIT